ncbi:DUF7091 family protein [Halohasta litorea]|uniref:Ferredoxin n=1 Tax=Halohasta litorea TaxID=869891 RepID=A0ABD6DB49_9EURY|nr:hypothetical protein [Halohasta litorea]
MDEGFEQFVRDRLRKLGKGYERTRRAYTEGKGEADGSPGEGSLPVDEAGRAKLVCRRYAEKRAVELDSEGKPACFDPDHTDCVGCVEDIQDGVIETWDDPRGRQ